MKELIKFQQDRIEALEKELERKTKILEEIIEYVE